MKKILLFLFVIIFTGCTIKPHFDESKSIFMLVKSPNLKFADSGFMKKTQNLLHVELFSASVLVLELDIKDNICVNTICYTKKQFNSSFLSPSYPDTLIENVLLGKKIFNSKGLIKTPNGYEQNIFTSGLNIKYKVFEDKIMFKDKTNSVFIKIVAS